MWDLFISHASEDKETFVRPLAETLVQYGIEVWYDEFALELGDSLTASIDKGLLNSKYGLIVFSPAFFEKRWTDYELKSLLTKEINGGKVILPIWHNVDQKFIASKSLFLADKKAISSNEGIPKLAFEILKVVRPDILNSHLIKMACRKAAGSVERVAVQQLHIAESIRHESLPVHLAIASRVISTLFPSISYEDTIINFAKDADYDIEFAIWIAISCAYIDTMKAFQIPLSDEWMCKQVYSYLLSLSLNDSSLCASEGLSPEMQNFMRSAYSDHANLLIPMVKKR